MRYRCHVCNEDITEEVEKQKARRKDPHVIAKSRSLLVYCSKRHENIFDIDD